MIGNPCNHITKMLSKFALFGLMQILAYFTFNTGSKKQEKWV
jgi:hypothetical protein